MFGFINLYFYSGLNPAYYPMTRLEITHPAYPTPPGPTPDPPAPAGSSHAGLIIGLIVLFLALGGGGYWLYRKR